MNKIKILAFTHKATDINDIGKLHIDAKQLQVRLQYLKEKANLDELLYLSTCNRVEFIFSNNQTFNKSFLINFFSAFNPDWKEKEINWAIKNAQLFESEEALRHLFNVASSIDSLVVGEREIITQVRNAYEKCNEYNLTGDLIRLAIKSTVVAAKDVYTHTNIAHNSISVVSLAYRKLRELNVKQDARFLIIGSGATNTTMAKYLKKHKFSNFTIFNRTIENAKKLAEELNSQIYTLAELKNYKKGFDIIITCTGASKTIITPAIYKSLVGKDASRKVVIDLAIPNDLDPAILNNYDINLIAINNLQDIAKENLMAREQELIACNVIIEKNISEFKQVLKTRKVELAMSEVPKKIKEIRETANEVFAKELLNLNSESKEVLDKILSYMEKNISVFQ